MLSREKLFACVSQSPIADGDKARPGFDQSPRGQQAFWPSGEAPYGSRTAGRFARNVQRLVDLVRPQDVERLLLEAVELLRQFRGLQRAHSLIQPGENLLPALQVAHREAVGQPQLVGALFLAVAPAAAAIANGLSAAPRSPRPPRRRRPASGRAACRSCSSSKRAESEPSDG